MTLKLYPNEVVLKAGDTSQVLDGQRIDGRLIITNQRVYFRPLDSALDFSNLEIVFDNILEVIYYGRGLLFGVKGLNIVTRDGRSLSFPLAKRDEMGEVLNRLY